MKKILNIFPFVVLLTMLTSCFKDSQVIFTGSLVEFNTTVISSPITGLTYPVVSVRNNSGNVTSQINLVAAQRSNPETIKVSVNQLETQKAINALKALGVNAIPAVQGTHFALNNNGNYEIPANSSFATFSFNVLNATPSTGQFAVVVFTLEGNGKDIKPNENYKHLGYRIQL